MKNIRKTLLKRIYAWEEAIQLADSPNFWRERLTPKEQEKERSEFPVYINPTFLPVESMGQTR
jgi:hypothetical protein